MAVEGGDLRMATSPCGRNGGRNPASPTTEFASVCTGPGWNRTTVARRLEMSMETLFSSNLTLMCLLQVLGEPDRYILIRDLALDHVEHHVPRQYRVYFRSVKRRFVQREEVHTR